MNTTPLEVTTHIAAPPEVVWTYLTDPARYALWMGTEVTLSPTPGGLYRVHMREGIEALGEFLEPTRPTAWSSPGDGRTTPSSRPARPPSKSPSRPPTMAPSCASPTAGSTTPSPWPTTARAGKAPPQARDRGNGPRPRSRPERGHDALMGSTTPSSG